VHILSRALIQRAWRKRQFIDVPGKTLLQFRAADLTMMSWLKRLGPQSGNGKFFNTRLRSSTTSPQRR